MTSALDLSRPDAAAIIMGRSGEVITFAELDERSARLAGFLQSRGLMSGSHVAVMMENNARYHEVVWGALRSGMHVTPINPSLRGAEIAYILDDCGAETLIVSDGVCRAVDELRAFEASAVHVRLAIGSDEVPDFEGYDEVVSGTPRDLPPVERPGSMMFYSSGTTGKPKGIRHVPPGPDAGTLSLPMFGLLERIFGFDRETVYLSPAPLYHAAPLSYSTLMQRIGASVVVMEEFDARHALELVGKHHVTHSQWVPTMFVRMLRLSSEERASYDGSTHRVAIHGAAPCPVPIKQQMIEWWGPILHEYYAGAEGNGLVWCDSEAWLRRPGTVGSAVFGDLHIVDDDGHEVPQGTRGTIYFGQGPSFEYHNDAAKTEGSRHPRGWSTLGDIGHLDADGFLFLSDRKAYMIISGGVNIYPQECEDVLITHPEVVDCAVFGIPNDEFGEEVKAVVQPRDMSRADDEFAAELMAFCRERLAAYKCPRTVDFAPELPRLASGKLLKHRLRDPYWAGHVSRVV